METEEAPDPFPTEAADVLFDFRGRFPDPLKKVTVGLRQFVDRESPGAQVTVGQHLKRAPQIIHKLWRHPGMNLPRMQDIGGCRAIVRDDDQVRGVARRIERNWLVKHRKHYSALGITGQDGMIADVSRTTSPAAHARSPSG